jgi:hypothetical protein
MFQTFFKLGETGQQQIGTRSSSKTRDDVAVEIDL